MMSENREMEVPMIKDSSSEEGDYLGVKSFKDAKFVVWSESVKIWKIAAPIAMSFLFKYLLLFSTSIYAGHLGDIQFSSLSLYGGVIGSLSVNFLYGMSSALATLCGQAYGAGQFQYAGIYVQRSCIVLFLVCILLVPLHIYATPILCFLGEDQQMAYHAGNYAIEVIPFIFSHAIIFPTQRFLQAQSKVNVIMVISLLGVFIQNGLLYVFVYILNWGISGLAIAINITSWFVALGQAVYAAYWANEENSGLSWWAFKDLWAFARLSFSMSIMSFLEQMSGNISTILVGQLDDAVIAVASYSICLNFQDAYSTLLLGISTAVSVRVSNTLGMSHPRAAKYSFLVITCETLLIGILVMTIIFLSKENLATIFTNSEDVIKAVSDLSNLLGVAMVLNSATQVISGVAAGSGWQVMVGYINLACYYIVGLSLAIFLAFHQHLGVKGLLGGAMCGYIIQILVLTVIIWKTNWTKEVEKTANRMQIWRSSNLRKNTMT